MLHIDIPTIAEFMALAEARSDACISLYLPTLPVCQHAANRIPYKDLTKDAISQLKDAGVDKRRIALLEGRLERLGGAGRGNLDDNKYRFRRRDRSGVIEEFWSSQANGLVVLAVPETIRTFRLPQRPKLLAEVADRSHLTPFIRAMTSPHDAYVLALAERSIRLLPCIRQPAAHEGASCGPAEQRRSGDDERRNPICSLMKLAKLAKRCRIDKPDKFRLSDHDPADTFGLEIQKHEAKAMLVDSIERLTESQERLYAQHRWAVLAIFQGMDAAGKDSAIKHVMSGVNPQGCEVHSFKAPSSEHLARDLLWRSVVRLPERGRIGIFNRSYYEEVLVVRVHPEKLEDENLPRMLITDSIWQEQFRSICSFEHHLARQGMLILKFFLNISKEEQRRRFLARIDDPAKRWKFSIDDVTERERWDAYMEAYEDMIRNTSRPEVPWYVVPADQKPLARLIVASVIVSAMDKLDLSFPVIQGEALQTLEKARSLLVAEAQPAQDTKSNSSKAPA